jgi:pseudaminic acid cytidylyltransferase
MSNLAIIPARGGSKRIPKKNIRLFGDKPIMLYPLEAAMESMLFDEIMVSTDDEGIAEMAKVQGAKIPFMRSKKNSDDYATITDVVMEVLEFYDKQGFYFENVCCLLPTAVFITPGVISEAFEKMQLGEFDAIFPIQRFSYPIDRALRVDELGKVSMINPENLRVRSQDLPESYHDCGQFYWAKVDAYRREGTFFCPNAGYIEFSSLRVHDIDVEEDWLIAEQKFSVLREIKNF